MQSMPSSVLQPMLHELQRMPVGHPASNGGFVRAAHDCVRGRVL